MQEANPKSATLFKGIVWVAALNLWVACGIQDGVDAYILTSPPGGPWTERNNPKNAHLREVVWSGQNLCAVGDYDGVDAYHLTSPDGIAWTERASLAGGFTHCVASDGAGNLLAATAAAGSRVLSSSDHGVTWAAVFAQTNDLFGAAHLGAGAYVLVGGSGAGAYIVTTPDRVNFTGRANPISNTWLSGVAVGRGRVVAVGNRFNGSAAIITSDDDGATWQGPWPNPRDATLFRVQWTGRQFLAMGTTAWTGDPSLADDGNGRAYIIASRDGRAWVELPHPRNLSLWNIARAPSGEAVAVGNQETGAGAYILRTGALA